MKCLEQEVRVYNWISIVHISNWIASRKNTKMSGAWGGTNSRAAGYSSNAQRIF